MNVARSVFTTYTCNHLALPFSHTTHWPYPLMFSPDLESVELTLKLSSSSIISRELLACPLLHHHKLGTSSQTVTFWLRTTCAKLASSIGAGTQLECLATSRKGPSLKRYVYRGSWVPNGMVITESNHRDASPNLFRQSHPGHGWQGARLHVPRGWNAAAAVEDSPADKAESNSGPQDLVCEQVATMGAWVSRADQTRKGVTTLFYPVAWVWEMAYEYLLITLLV